MNDIKIDEEKNLYFYSKKDKKYRSIKDPRNYLNKSITFDATLKDTIVYFDASGNIYSVRGTFYTIKHVGIPVILSEFFILYLDAFYNNKNENVDFRFLLYTWVRIDVNVKSTLKRVIKYNQKNICKIYEKTILDYYRKKGLNVYSIKNTLEIFTRHC